jgi:hypothetical protein
MSDLLPGQEELLEELIETTQSLPRHAQELTLISGTDQEPGELVLTSDGKRIRALRSDIWQLKSQGFVSGQWNISPAVPVPFGLTKAAYDWYQGRRKASDAMGGVEADVEVHLRSTGFMERFPDAFQRWSEASDLLRSSTPEQDLTTIGHKAREAMQRFASALVDRYQPPDVEANVAKTINRMKAAVDIAAPDASSRRRAVLDALFELWKATNDLVQRQEHADQKAGDPVTWDDARATVFQVGNVMFEVDRVLEPPVS